MNGLELEIREKMQKIDELYKGCILLLISAPHCMEHLPVEKDELISLLLSYYQRKFDRALKETSEIEENSLIELAVKNAENTRTEKDIGVLMIVLACLPEVDLYHLEKKILEKAFSIVKNYLLEL